MWIHGSEPHERLTYGDLVAKLVQSGVAFASFDKRGVGESEGKCCPGDKGHFNLLAADAAGAIRAVASRGDVDDMRVGFLGASQAGWIAPLAAVRSGHVAFIALVDAPTVSYGEESLYSELTGEEGGGKPKPRSEIARRLDEAGPSGFDPKPSLARLTIPGLWLFGGHDLSQPTDRSVRVLERLKARGKEFDYVVYPSAGHGLLDTIPSDPRAAPAAIAWIVEHVRRPA